MFICSLCENTNQIIFMATSQNLVQYLLYKYYMSYTKWVASSSSFPCQDFVHGGQALYH